MANLVVTHTESLTLNGSQQGGTNTLTITGINEVYKRVVTITTTETNILSFDDAAIGQGKFIEANVRYIRFTNLDGTNFITLTFTNEDGDEAAMILDKGCSFIFNADLDGGVVNVFNATENANANSDAALGDLTLIQADANSSSCKLEVFVATL